MFATSNMARTKYPALDHLVLLVNDPVTASGSHSLLHVHRHRSGVAPLETAVGVFAQLGFQVLPGGVHADGLTSNALIVFPDGVYIELIQFEAAPAAGSGESRAAFEARRAKHWWYACKPGWIDWCLADGISDGVVEEINRNARRLRAQSVASIKAQPSAADTVVAPRLLYEPALEGGRVTPGGTEIAWKVTFPSAPHGQEQVEADVLLPVGNVRSHVPFWCHDVTPRDHRVPAANALHPNRSPGIAQITLLYAKDTLRAYLDLSLSLNQSIEPTTLPISSESQLIPHEIPYKLLETPVEEHGRPRHPLIKVCVKVAEDPADLKWVETHGEGLYEVEVFGMLCEFY